MLASLGGYQSCTAARPSLPSPDACGLEVHPWAATGAASTRVRTFPLPWANPPREVRPHGPTPVVLRDRADQHPAVDLPEPDRDAGAGEVGQAPAAPHSA